jgi:hypothetical protein
MNNNTTNKKKLELKKTAIANLTLSESQMKAVVGGLMPSGDQYCMGVDTDNCTRDVGYTNCTGDIAKKTI